MARLRHKLVAVIALALAGLRPCAADTLYIPVLSHPVPMGQEFAPSDFLTKEYEVSPVARANFVTDLSQLAGTVAMKSLPAGRPIPLNAVGTAPAVRKGKNTMVRYVLDGIEIQGVLVPLQDAAAGETIACRNPASGVTVNALALADGSLSVASAEK